MGFGEYDSLQYFTVNLDLKTYVVYFPYDIASVKRGQITCLKAPS